MKFKLHTYVFVALTAISLTISCLDNKQSEDSDSEVVLFPRGEELMRTNCSTCHSGTTVQEEQLAPSMYTIKQHYLEEEMDMKEFTEAMVVFLQEPSESSSRMPEAVLRFGLMPKFAYTEQQLNDMAEYIYHADFQEPDQSDKSYESHGEFSEDVPAGFEELGLSYAMATKAVLGKNLMGQITAYGTEEALSFCNERALPLTDSVAGAQSVNIKRVSERPRNPANRANEKETKYIQNQKMKLANGVKARPKTFQENGSAIGYYPIMTNTMCLQCHGVLEENIRPEVHQKILELYPNDEATGYGENELRGIWVIEKGLD